MRGDGGGGGDGSGDGGTDAGVSGGGNDGRIGEYGEHGDDTCNAVACGWDGGKKTRSVLGDIGGSSDIVVSNTADRQWAPAADALRWTVHPASGESHVRSAGLPALQVSVPTGPGPPPQRGTDRYATVHDVQVQAYSNSCTPAGSALEAERITPPQRHLPSVPDDNGTWLVASSAGPPLY